MKTFTFNATLKDMACACPERFLGEFDRRPPALRTSSPIHAAQLPPSLASNEQILLSASVFALPLLAHCAVQGKGNNTAK
jgi:hypothetical protein